ncbi:DUF6192 family protein [Nonomuraea sp. NPDC026600]
MVLGPAFGTIGGRVVPGLRGHQFTADERAAVARNVARVCLVGHPRTA